MNTLTTAQTGAAFDATPDMDTLPRWQRETLPCHCYRTDKANPNCPKHGNPKANPKIFIRVKSGSEAD